VSGWGECCVCVCQKKYVVVVVFGC
jgi:hypothetical protein